MIEQDTELTSGNMPARFFGGILLGLFVLLGTGYGVDYFLSQGTMPRGTMIGGVQVGGMKRADAKELLQKELADEIIKPVTITAGQRASIIDPRAAGLRVNWDKTLDSVESQSLNPIKRILGFFKDTEVPIVSDADPANFRPAVDRVTKELSPAPVDAGIVLTGGSSLLPGMAELAEDIFLKPVRVGAPAYSGSLSDVVRTPRYATAMGLLEEARQQRLKGRKVAEQSGSFRDTIRRMKEWFFGSF